MEDAAEALKLAFSVFIFAFGLALAFSIFSQCRELTDIIIENNDRDYIVSYQEASNEEDKGRIVGAETVVPTLYRYYKENFAIDIVDSNNQVKEVFDLAVERNYNQRVNKIEPNDPYKSFNPINKGSRTIYRDIYPTNVQWVGPHLDTDTKLRVDSYVSNSSQIINGVKVKHKTTFDFNKTYHQIFLDEYEGNKVYYAENDENWDGTYIIDQAGGTEIYITYQEID